MRRGQRPRAQLDVEPGERLPDARRAAQARRRERDELVLAAGGLAHAGERAADVVADARRRMRERADVEGDSHGR